MKHFLLISLLFTFISVVQGQDKKLVQITGRVYGDYLQPLKYVNISVLNKGRGSITDNEGKFSFVVVENDTLIFSSVGFKTSRVVVPDTLTTPFYTRDVLMQGDTILIETVNVYQWSDYAEFKEVFLELELPEDELERARKNIEIIKAQIYLSNHPSASENYNFVMQNTFNEISSRNMAPSYKILNPLNWAKFFSAFKNGDFNNK